jgi:hypothetical protein
MAHEDGDEVEDAEESNAGAQEDHSSFCVCVTEVG